MTRALLLLALAAAACSAPTGRFPDRPILWRDPDDAPIPVPPFREYGIMWTGARDAIFAPVERGLTFRYGGESVNVNALDEVPDSTWWVDPRRDPMTRDDQVRLRPLGAHFMDEPGRDPPVAPYTVTNGKDKGSALGFQVVDARGQRWLFKLDPPGHAGLVTSTEVVATRLARASGWRVPDSMIVEVTPGDFKLAEGAKTRNRFNDVVPFTAADLATVLRKAGRTRDGALYALASRWIPGKMVGRFAWAGRNPHDPNDRVPHEDRRDLRAFGVWAAWVNNIDVFENNTYDTYVGEPGRGHLLHYHQDVGGSFGNFAAAPMSDWMSIETAFAPGRIATSFVTLGGTTRRWDEPAYLREVKAVTDAWPDIGFFTVEHFDPRGWQPILTNPALLKQTPRDRYWGAKRIVALSPEEVKAAIAAGRYRPEASTRLFEVLWGRREKIARAFFSDVAPLDRFSLEGDRLCFVDLWLEAGLGGAEGTIWTGRVDGGRPVVATPRGGGGCLALPRDAKASYRVVELRARHPGERRPGPAVRVHLVRRADGVRRLVGVER